jgi:RNase H-fold protein (predicted Holliday junction resolvase)
VTRHIQLIVEGQGDVLASSSLLAKIVAKFNVDAVVVGSPIRAGEAKKLRRQGELERYITLAASHENVDEIFILLDLDDDCAKEWHEHFSSRAESHIGRGSKTIKVVFCVREFESWFLSGISGLRVSLPEYVIDADAEFRDAELIRAAKERLYATCKGKKYKQMRDQNIFAKKIILEEVFANNRSFRKFVKEATDLSYERIAAIFNSSNLQEVHND